MFLPVHTDCSTTNLGPVKYVLLPLLGDPTTSPTSNFYFGSWGSGLRTTKGSTRFFPVKERKSCDPNVTRRSSKSRVVPLLLLVSLILVSVLVFLSSRTSLGPLDLWVCTGLLPALVCYYEIWDSDKNGRLTFVHSSFLLFTSKILRFFL